MKQAKKYLNMIRPFDVIIVVGLLAASFIPLIIFSHQQQANQANTVLTAVVTHDGQEVYRIRLTGHRGTTRYRYHHGNDWNEIVATGNQIAITAADCADQVCVRKGKISRAGDTIVCLPHKLLVAIHSSRGSSTNTGGMVSE
ncbi:NusG domain II-containing protein [Lacticaseibacillus nasuensis]|uniref:NusG domain II-containing protein n=1 Tax=Lacticaseibacillus nasuensis TaxID=944671 RepID=UPI0022479DB9|nr:NusG domain II-containing protein [Lacticaseibacillus nasuensis]MCX2454509.1 NusG domain II-containing protein [Lacticaseibacillus nasuensis]